jgi:hypothetical protein
MSKTAKFGKRTQRILGVKEHFTSIVGSKRNRIYYH